MAITILFFLCTLLYKAIPVAIGADPPTIALFGYIPKGVKKACILPPSPLLKPVCLPKISESKPNRKISTACSLTLDLFDLNFSTICLVSIEFNFDFKSDSDKFSIAKSPLARVSP